MAKKKFSIKDIQIYIAIGGLIIGLITTFVKLSLSAENTKTKVDKLETKVEETDKENDEKIDDLKKENAELDKAIVAQTVQLKNIESLLDKIDKKLEKKK